jgi:hypothetical protein
MRTRFDDRRPAGRTVDFAGRRSLGQQLANDLALSLPSDALVSQRNGRERPVQGSGLARTGYFRGLGCET